MSAADRQDIICKKKITREINRKTKEEACRERLRNPRPQNHEANVSKYTNTRSATREEDLDCKLPDDCGFDCDILGDDVGRIYRAKVIRGPGSGNLGD